MKIVIAPDSFKESLSAAQAAESIARGFRKVFPDAGYDLVPMADGGEGTVSALVAATQGELQILDVQGPLGASVSAQFGLLGDRTTAVVEMAEASGLARIPQKQRDPLQTSTFGTGELIRAALDLGCRTVIIGLGGSATCDGGIGALAALGVRFLDSRGEPVSLNGAGLAHIAHIDTSGLDPRVTETKVLVACDVDNPLLGSSGAAAVYAPQKGASPQQVDQLEAGMRHYADRVHEALGLDAREQPGVGAAGGLGFALVTFLGAELRAGAQLVAEAVSLEHRMQGATLVLTGEGEINQQTVCGKTPQGVARIAKTAGVAVIGIAGSLGEGYEAVWGAGIDAVESLAPGPISLESCLDRADTLLEQASERVARILKLGIEIQIGVDA